MKRLLAFFIAFVSLTQLHSQFANNWKIGNGYGLDFTTPTPVVIGSAITGHPDNSSSISDASGNLLFYTTGTNVWNRNNIIMPNGSGLIGSYTGGQCALIIPIPCNAGKYVIFHTTEFSNPGNLSYSVVDMALNAGLGDVVAGQKNVSLGTGWSEKICAYYNAANNCFWVLTHKWMSDQFVAFRVDASSIATTSVVSSIGSIHNCGSFGGAHDSMGQLTISPDGTKVVNALTCQDKFEFFDFNQATGVVSNSISIAGNGGSAWGTAFSPDSKKVYVNSIFGSSVFQYDISTFTSAAILASKTTVYNTGLGGYNFGYMELGPNGKIYMPRPNTNFLSAINSPNLAGTACNFSYSAISTGTATVQWGMSRIAYNIPASFLSPTFSLTPATSSVTCNNTSNGSATITPSSAGTYTYNWQPGNLSTPVINNLSAGIYTVTVSNACGSSSTTVSVLQQPTPTLSIGNATACLGSTVNILANTIGGSPGYTYSWSQGSSTTAQVNITASPTPITCTVTDSQGCKANASATITINNPGVSSFQYSLNACKGILTTTNTSAGASQYFWYFGDGSTSIQTSPSYTYSLPGTYTISLITNPFNGCKDSTSQTVTISNPTQSLYTFTNVSCDSTVLLNNTSVGATIYLWDFGDGNTSTNANPGSHGYSSQGTYTITLITNPGSNCADTLKQVVNISKNVISQFNSTSSQCTMSVSTVNTSSFATNYAWDFGDGFTSTNTNPGHVYSSQGTYTVSLIANPGTNCADTSYNTVTITGPPIALFSYIKDPCSGIVTFTNNSINSVSYQWNFGGVNTSNLTNPTFNFNKPGTYTVSLTAQPGSPCASTVTQTIIINYISVHADFNYYNPEYTNDVQFINLSQNAINYEWSFGDGFGETIFEPGHTYNQMGEFFACLQATNILGCSDVICKKIKVDSDWTLYIPDAFTPNTDGINDLFFAKGTNIIKFNIMIFDRWGEKIFSSNDIMTPWDGKCKGKPVQEDVYIWKVNFTDIHSESHDKTGHVTVIR